VQERKKAGMRPAVQGACLAERCFMMQQEGNFCATLSTGAAIGGERSLSGEVTRAGGPMMHGQADKRLNSRVKGVSSSEVPN